MNAVLSKTERVGGARRGGRWIRDWEPDNPAFWSATGRRVARRNLVFSIFAEHLGFTVWTLWSIVVVSLGPYQFSTDQKFWLVALPNLIGSMLRIPYGFLPARVGGRNWTVVSVLLLLVPVVSFAVAVSNPATPFWLFLLIAATAGFGGGNFASSMANISYFFPHTKQGWALGLNAAGGNIGVSTMQLVIPLAIGAFGVAVAGLFWVPLVLLAGVCVYFFMDNLTTARSDFREQVRITRRGQTWVMAILYTGTFGSFIGYATAFPLLIESQFPELPGMVSLAFLGPLAGSLSRPFGGWLSDHFGGAGVTFWNFGAMVLGIAGIWASLQAHRWSGFLAAFLLLFVATGIGNGSTYRMIPAIFKAQALDGVPEGNRRRYETDVKVGKRDSAAAIGFVSAVGAVGGFFINRGFGTSIATTGGAEAALTGFAIFYGACLAVTWWCYLRRRIAVRVAPSLAAADV